MVRVFAIPIIVFWALLAVSTNTFMPQVERVAEELAGPMVPHYAPSQRALLAIGAKFQESDSTSLTMVVLEANRPLGDQDHQYYDDLMRRLLHDTKHVQSAIDLWGKPITAAGAQSLDGKCTYVLLRLAGDIGQMKANESVEAVRDIVATGHAAARAQGLRQRRGSARHRHCGYCELQLERHHDRDDLPHHRDVAAGVPLRRHPVCALGRSLCSSCWSRRGLSQPLGISGTSSSRHSP